MNARVIASWVVAALLTGASLGAAQTADPRDVKVGDNIVRQVNSYAKFTIFDDVNANIDQGVVVLTGRVTMPYKKDDIGKRIAGIDGVASVQNNIEVLPVSQFDDDLRFRIARAIYSNPNFRPFATMVNPPIHVIVERGRVTLEGVVNSEVDRMLARSIASNFLAFGVKNDLKTEAEAKAELERL